MPDHPFLPPTYPPTVAVRRLEAADLAWAAPLLALATAGHPAVRYVCAGTGAGRQRRWLLGQLLALALRYGGAYTNAAGTALVLWLAPAPPAAWWLGQLPAALWGLGWAGCRRLRRLLRTAAWLRHQSLAGPHHQLLAVAVHPQARGRGEGRRLLAATLALRQAPPLPSYFSAQEPSQLAYYQRLGFELTGHCAVGQGPSGLLGTWGLLRPAPP